MSVIKVTDIFFADNGGILFHTSSTHGPAVWSYGDHRETSLIANYDTGEHMPSADREKVLPVLHQWCEEQGIDWNDYEMEWNINA